MAYETNDLKMRLSGKGDFLIQRLYVTDVTFEAPGDRWDKPALNYTHTSTNLNKATTMYNH